MKITTDKIENRQAHLTVEIEPPEYEEGLNKAYGRLVKKYNVPGFRKGKAPRPILEQYIGKSALVEDAVEHMAPEAYERAVKEQQLEPLSAQPEVHLDKADPVTYKFIVPLQPVVKLGNYKEIRGTPEPVEVKEEDIDGTIESLRRYHGVWEPVERQVNSRDLVTLDIESEAGGKPFITQKDAELEVEKQSDFPVPGFAEQLIGMQRGETKEFKVTLPADYGKAELAGQEVSFKVTVKEIKQQRLPELNDDFAKQVNAEFKTLADLRTNVSENVKAAKETNARKGFEQKIISQAVEQAEVEYPPMLVESETDNLIRDQMRRWQIDEKGMDEYLKSIQRTAEQLREELRPIAERGVKQSLVLTEIARQEGIQVSQEDIKNNIESMAQTITPENRDTYLQLLTRPQSQVNIASSIATRKTIDRLAEIAQGKANENSQTITEGEQKAAEFQAAPETTTTQSGAVETSQIASEEAPGPRNDEMSGKVQPEEAETKEKEA